ncbi:hypothetical protein SteCoe_18702 [Stentor coeruleus]|uniref:RBR-type E3 ubiquitin transferase n=1 Tax=Stentor coeruleus TaxID=5963 RepID=A0A1R2BVZ3_9CILI|nr:hypothetical protein SteCoe_18702 [Stentor coeruleus]
MDYSELERPLLETNNLCEICCCNIADSKLSCGHSFCRNCITQYINGKIMDGEVLEIRCPTISCYILDQNSIKIYISEEMFDKYKEFIHRKHMESDVNFRWCPQKNCKGFDIYESSNKLTCQDCSYSFCFLCADSWHDGQCKALKTSGFLFWSRKKKVKFCPVCRVRTEKNGGCPSMTCRKCSTSWCWLCEKPNDNHDAFKCLVGEKWYNPNFLIVLALALAPLTLLYMPLIFFVILADAEELENNPNVLVKFFFRHYILTALLLLIFAPFISVLVCTFGILYTGITFSYKYALYPYHYETYYKVLHYLSIFLLAMCAICFIIILGFLLISATVVVGFVMLIIKVPVSLFLCLV